MTSMTLRGDIKLQYSKFSYKYVMIPTFSRGRESKYDNPAKD